MSFLSADFCCVCTVKCGVNGELVGEFVFTDLNQLDTSGSPTQFQGPIQYQGANLTGHFVLAYAGEGAWTATQSGVTRWFTIWDFAISVGSVLFGVPAYSRGIPEGADPLNGHIGVGGPFDPTYQFGGVACDGVYFDGVLGNVVDWYSNYTRSGHVWPIDNSDTQALAEAKCLAIEIFYQNDVVYFGYSRSTHYTVAMAGTKPPKFRLYKIKPSLSIVGGYLFFDGTKERLHVLVQNNDRTWVWFVDGKVVGADTIGNRQLLRSVQSYEDFYQWPNTNPGTLVLPATVEVQVIDHFTHEVVVDQSLTLAILLVGTGASLQQNNGNHQWLVELDFKNNGNVDIVNASVALSAPGMTGITITQGNPFNIAGDLPPPNNHQGLLTTAGVLFLATFANVNNTVTATITYGGQTFTVLFTVNGTT